MAQVWAIPRVDRPGLRVPRRPRAAAPRDPRRRDGGSALLSGLVTVGGAAVVARVARLRRPARREPRALRRRVPRAHARLDQHPRARARRGGGRDRLHGAPDRRHRARAAPAQARAGRLRAVRLRARPHGLARARRPAHRLRGRAQRRARAPPLAAQHQHAADRPPTTARCATSRTRRTRREDEKVAVGFDPDPVGGRRARRRSGRDRLGADRDARGLRYVHDDDPGYRRKKAGKGFTYLDTRGRPITVGREGRADQGARDPARVDRRVDLPARGRPPAGHRPRRRRAASSTATTRTGARCRRR